METITCPQPPPVRHSPHGSVRLPLGLLGFEHFKRFRLIGQPAEAPFLWLRVETEPALAFLVVPPATVLGEYQPELSGDDVRFLALQQPADALVLNIVTVRPGHNATVNLKGPLVINARTRVGKQVVPLNAADYSVQHPLSTAA